jgi:hypothetical protein
MERIAINVPQRIEHYKTITDLLTPFIPHILTGKHIISDVYYAPQATRPDLASSFAPQGKLQNYALTQNLRSISEEISTPATHALNQLLSGGWERGGAFLYPANNGYMDWHTNHETPGPRIYLVWCAEGETSRFLFSEDGKSVVTTYEPAGWSVNVFMLRGKENPFWHAVSSGNTNRISFGFRKGTSASYKKLNTSQGLISG